ncbi:hypothetical protein HF086_015222 [Spodoptera exigua]|uniref:LMBR1 domain-containing protein 2 homolog n=1 Tax=Spodoptera exigua TaxID=7107 RepID=A0A922M9C7_SPOEX|nr:hypothetical protein HF086_015222 [Spodoptera exigua]
MAYTLFVIELISAFVLAATLLYRYGDCYRNHIIVTVSVLTAWYFSFVIMFILPLDISSTVYRQCMENATKITETTQSLLQNSTTTVAPPGTECIKPYSFMGSNVFPNLWRIVYWTSQCLTWLIMPMMQSYSKAGDFTVKGKLKSALVDNAIYYGSYLFICGILLIYIALKPDVHLDPPKIKTIASSASNTWGLFLLILLLGYALVEVPRNLWNNSKKNYTLTYCYFKIAKLSTDKCEAEETVDDILDSLKAVTAAVGSGHPLYRHVDTIVQKLPIQLRDRLNGRAPPDRPIPPSLKSLVNLHKKTIKALHVLQRTETQWGLMLERIFHLEDVATNQRSPDHRFQHTFHTPRPRLQRIFYPPIVEWYWECFLRQYFLKTMAVITGIMSVAVVWSEMTFFCKKPVLSIFANIVIAATDSYNYLAIEAISTIIIAYMFYCAYSTVLKIRLLNLYYLAPHHQTNEYSLIFSGMMVCRLTPAMCLNFLSLIHMDSHVIKTSVMETYYTQTLDFITNALEKRKRQRAEESLTRRRDYSERFSNYRSARDVQDGAHTGLLNDLDSDYYVQPSPERNQPQLTGYQRAELPYNRANLTLEDELDHRFGESTLPSIRSEFDDRRRDKMTIPPRGLFDDV